MIRTGIFGGSFNPIHQGHIALAETICQSNLTDEVWLLVSPQNPLKQHQHLIDESLRLELARIAVKKHPSLFVSDFEFHLPRPSFMYHTLEELDKAYPDRQFQLIVGADNWINFKDWYRSADILKKYHLLVYPRKDCQINPQSLPSNVHLIQAPLFPISSTEIRHQLAEGKDVAKWLDPDVEKKLRTDYLTQHKGF